MMFCEVKVTSNVLHQIFEKEELNENRAYSRSDEH